tara:strand:+ start:222 stop:491 length:270 start_codon:yes stop_codon:yes gene_type:complete
MWLLTIKDKQNEGAYAVQDGYGDKVLFLFEQEDDAERYAMMINEQDVKRQMDIIEVEDELALKTCKMYNYKYAVITPDDIVIPPKNDNV